MDANNFKTPVSPSRLPRFDPGASTSRAGVGASAVKRDPLAAELERGAFSFSFTYWDHELTILLPFLALYTLMPM